MEPSASPALRIATPRWGRTRLWLGLALVLVAVVGVSLVVRATDHRSEVWTVRHDLARGTTLTADDVAVAAVHVPSLGNYVPAATSVVGQVLTRDVGAGDLLSASALSTAATTRLVTVPVEQYHLPADLRRGEKVDVYLVVRGPTGQPAGDPIVVMEAATVAQVDDEGSSFGGSSATTGVVLSVPSSRVAALVGAASRGSLTLVRDPFAS